jgi:hypothetical protein
MKFLVREWLQMSKEERIRLLEMAAYRQREMRKKK